MKLVWLVFCLLSFSGFIAAQEGAETYTERSVVIPVDNKEALQILVKKLVDNQNTALFRECFLDKETAADFVTKVFAGTENAHQPERKEAVTGYYFSLSSNAAAYFSSIPGLQDIRLVETMERPGATDLMKVLVLKMNLFFQDGTSRGQRVNVVETDKGYRILNLED